MILGQTRGYLFSVIAMLLVTLWSPTQLAYTKPVTNSVIDNSLVFNSTILKLSAQFDSSEQSITTKVALVDSQNRIIQSKLNKLTHDNTEQDLVNYRDNSGNEHNISSFIEGMSYKSHDRTIYIEPINCPYHSNKGQWYTY